MSTHVTKLPEIELGRRHYVVDADGQVLGRLATSVAAVLRGKGKTNFSPHLDTGDYVIIVNAEKIQLTGKKLDQRTGKKLDQRTYFSHSGHPGAGKYVTVRTMMEKRPNEVVRRAVKGMLPKNKLGRKMLKKLRVYAGPDHPHQAQSPEPLVFTVGLGGSIASAKGVE
jgi:large subunit ribosomal protein L13